MSRDGITPRSLRKLWNSCACTSLGGVDLGHFALGKEIVFSPDEVDLYETSIGRLDESREGDPGTLQIAPAIEGHRTDPGVNCAARNSPLAAREKRPRKPDFFSVSGKCGTRDQPP